MKITHSAFVALLALVACGEPAPIVSPNPTGGAADAATDSATSTAPASRFGYPVTRFGTDSDTLHGTVVPDPYRWLEDEKSPEVRDWLSAQNAFARKELSTLPDRAAIEARLKKLFYVESASTPRRRGGRVFLSKRDAGREKWVVVERVGAKDRILLDPHDWSTDGSVSLGQYFPSWDGKKIAYTVKKNNSDEATLHVLDVETAKEIPGEKLEGAKYASVSWTPKSDAFYYTYLPSSPTITESERPGFAEIRLHKLGTPQDQDALIRERTNNPKAFLSAGISRSGKWLLAQVEHGWSRTDVWIQEQTKKGPSKWQPVFVGNDGIYDAHEYKDYLYVRTNDGAPKWRVIRVDPKNPGRAHWKEIVPERKDATLQDFSIVGGRLSLGYLKDVVSHVEVVELSGKPVRTVPLPALGAASELIGDPDSDVAYYQFSSYTYPTEIYETSVKTGKSKLWYRAPADIRSEDFVVEQKFATSKDGTRVPFFIVRGKDTKLDGSARTMLHGYGGFQVALTPGYYSNIFPWVERGGIYVFANLRGGSEYGEAWHKAGMGTKKQNVFDDYIAVAEELIRTKYTSPKKLIIRGASNGGLLVGAAMTQRPDLFRGVLCGVPLLDMVRYHKWKSGKTWIEEYGSADDPDQFRAIYAYSPYHNVKPGVAYPAVMILTADTDDRVDPLHARKFAALLQRDSTGGIVLLRVEKNAGHGGAGMVRSAVEKGTDELAFALSLTSN